MKLLGIRHFTRLKKKNRGNTKLVKAIDKLIDDLKRAQWSNKDEVLSDRSDADCIHSDGFYFFNINIHKTMILIEYSLESSNNNSEEDTGVANILWVGSHDDYERVFKNNKSTINKWLRDQGLID